MNCMTTPLNKIKWFILGIVQNFAWLKNKNFINYCCLLWILIKSKKLLLMIYSKNCTGKRKSVKRFRSSLILNILQILNKLSLCIRSNLDVLCLINLSVLPTKERCWMMEYDQSWFERMWYKRHDLLFQDL